MTNDQDSLEAAETTPVTQADTSSGLDTAESGDLRCLNCDQRLNGRYCSQCGQEAKPPLAKLGVSLREMAREFAAFDYRVIRTLRGLLFAPGVVTWEYARGKRASYTPPFRLYLGVSAVLIAMMTVTGLVNIEEAVAEMPANQRAQLEQGLGVDLASPEVARRFDDRFNAFFPLLNLLTPLGLALALKVVLPSRLFHEHAIAGFHIATTQVLITYALLPLATLGQKVQIIFSLLLIVGLSVHFWLFLRRMYGGESRRTLRLFAALALAYTLIGGFISSAALFLVIKTL